MHNQINITNTQSSASSQKAVVLSLKVAGDRETILDLLEKMINVNGFSVLEGSFVVNPQQNSIGR